jgi:hypothetical protein
VKTKDIKFKHESVIPEKNINSKPHFKPFGKNDDAFIKE